MASINGGERGNKREEFFEIKPALLEIDELKNEGAIKNFGELKDRHKEYLESGGSKGTRGDKLLQKLTNLGNSLSVTYSQEIDPIIYLMQLYYGEGLAIKTILEGINQVEFFYKDESGLRKLFTGTFKWRLRKNSGITGVTSETKNSVQDTLKGNE